MWVACLFVLLKVYVRFPPVLNMKDFPTYCKVERILNEHLDTPHLDFTMNVLLRLLGYISTPLPPFINPPYFFFFFWCLSK